MQYLRNKYAITLVVAILVLGVSILVASKRNRTIDTPSMTQEIVAEVRLQPFEKHQQLGKSLEGRSLDVYSYGSGSKHLVFVGGMHGGYEWNSVLLAYQMMDYIKENPSFVPEGVTVSIVPVANPDGLYKVIKKNGRFTMRDVPDEVLAHGTGRFNARNVDLNRNFDCKWKPESTWQNKIVSAGTKAFSEPEAVAIRDYVLATKPVSVIFWHSKANAVYAAECHKGVLPRALDVMNAYANASGYKAVTSFDAYAVSGDAESWLASIGIPSVTVELATHENVELKKNIAGVSALITYFSTVTK